MRIDWHNHDRLLICLFLAGVFHAVVILGLSFDFPRPKPIAKSLDIVLVQSPSQKAPEKADFLAPENQFGSGEATEKAAPKMAPAPLQGEGKLPHKPAHEQKPTPATKIRPVLKQAKSEKEVVQETGKDATVDEAPPRLSAESLSQQIAEVSTEFNKSLQNQAKQPRVAYINSVNAHRYKAAAYEAAWQEKVERIGTLNYPDEARRKKLSGSLILAVGLRPDGSIYSIKLRQSSGEPVLDQAAERIVHLAAPFAPFPEELKQEFDVLIITRTWRFSVDNRLETGH